MKTLSSRFYDALVEHRRLEPVEHSFRYPIRMFGLDLKELSKIQRHVPIFAYNRWNIFSLHDRDYLTPGNGSIVEKLTHHLRSFGFVSPLGRVFLVNAPRCITRVFNPVSFYFLYGLQSELVGMVAEVNNTFGERHLYLLTEADSDSKGFYRRYHAPKVFHVSPFHDMEGRYEFLVQNIEQELDIRVRLWKEERMVFEARLHGRSMPLQLGTLLRDLVRRPTVAHKTMPRILWEAYRLYRGHKLPVYSRPVARHPLTLIKNPPSVIDRRLQSWFLRLLEQIRVGCLTLTLPDGSLRYFGQEHQVPHVHVQVHDPGFFRHVFFGGDVGLGESFMDGAWDTENLTEFIRLLILNREALEDKQSAASKALGILNRWRHLARANTLVGSRRNIRRHYDLSNELFAAFLDDSMTYSCALFADDEEDLETAQRRKLQRIMDKARLSPEDHVLEIGCGWGSFAVAAAQHVGCRVTGITVSEAQRRLAVERIRQLGLQDFVTIELMDYRHVRGRFDKIVSIEMLKAVGHEYYPQFFACCERLLAPNGLVVLQTITIPDYRYEAYRRGCDWIQKYIFPGGMLPSLSALCSAMAKTSRLHVESLENIGIHYARTLRLWRERFLNRWKDLEQLGFDETFRRMWLYYLCFCEAAFATRTLNDLQLVLSRPRNTALDQRPRSNEVLSVKSAREKLLKAELDSFSEQAS